MSYRGPKARLIRRFGEDFTFSSKYERILKRRPYPAGQHGPDTRRRRMSEYGMRLFEKQKLKAIYNISETQLVRMVQIAKRRPGATGTNLLQLLEQRLDNVVFRLGYATTIWNARQLVNHGHMRVNGRKVDIPSFLVRPGDTITVKQRMRDNPQIVEALSNRGASMIPPYLSMDHAQQTGVFLRLPERSEIPVRIEDGLIVEFYAGR